MGVRIFSKTTQAATIRLQLLPGVSKLILKEKSPLRI